MSAVRSRGALLPVEAGAAQADGSAGASDPCRCARFLNQAYSLRRFCQASGRARPLLFFGVPAERATSGSRFPEPAMRRASRWRAASLSLRCLCAWAVFFSPNWPASRSLRKLASVEEYSPSRRSSAPNSPGLWQASASLRMRSLVGGRKAAARSALRNLRVRAQGGRRALVSVVGELGCRVVCQRRIHVRNPFSALAIYTISCTGFCLTPLWHTGVTVRRLYAPSCVVGTRQARPGRRNCQSRGTWRARERQRLERLCHPAENTRDLVSYKLRSREALSSPLQNYFVGIGRIFCGGGVDERHEQLDLSAQEKYRAPYPRHCP